MSDGEEEPPLLLPVAVPRRRQLAVQHRQQARNQTQANRQIDSLISGIHAELRRKAFRLSSVLS